MRLAVLFLVVLSGCSSRHSHSPDELYRSGENLLREGKLSEALAKAESGLRAEPSWRFRLLKAQVLLSSSAERAIETLQSSDPFPSLELQARVQMYRGWAKFYLSDYSGAQAALTEAHNSARPVRSPLLDAEIGLAEGTLLAQQGNTEAADQVFRSVLRIAVDRGDLLLEARTMGSLGVLFLRTNHPDEAIYWFEKDRQTSEHLGLVRQVATALGNLGVCYSSLGDYDRALSYLTDAEALVQKIGDRRYQQKWLGVIGNTLLDRGDFQSAMERHKQALEIARELNDKNEIGWWLYNLALASLRLGDFDTAERYNNEALALKLNLFDRSDFYPRVNEAQIAAGRKDFTRAEKLFRALLSEPSDDPVPVLEAQSGLADVLVQTQQFDRADAQFRSAISIVEHQRTRLTREEHKLSYLSSLIHFYHRYVDFLVSRGQPDQALEVAESSRARVLNERFQTVDKIPRKVNAAALRQVARGSGSVLLSYWLAPDRSFLWVIAPAGITLYQLPPEKQIEALVTGYGSFVESLSDPLQSEYSAGKKLAEILLGPVRPLLASGARVIVVPDRSLHSLNLETLPDPEDASRYLIERVTVSIAPSLGVLTEIPSPAPAGTRSILLMGDPEPAVEEYPRLPYAAREMELVEKDFAADRQVVMEGPAAYPAAYREARPERFAFIHFAAHATANRESPLDSALILSRHDAGYSLSARDVMNVALNADLVTLSACRSAGAKTYSGEGLVGLSWAFLRAGARSVVAGLWDVTDMSTAILMGNFYQLLAKNVAPADALREAKLGLIRSKTSYRKPFYWGPFQLYVGSSVNKLSAPH